MWQRWQPSTIVDNDHYDDAVECTATCSDGEEHQPDRRQPIHTPGASAWGANGSAGATSWHQWRSLGFASHLFCVSCCGPIASSSRARWRQQLCRWQWGWQCRGDTTKFCQSSRAMPVNLRARRHPIHPPPGPAGLTPPQPAVRIASLPVRETMAAAHHGPRNHGMLDVATTTRCTGRYGATRPAGQY